MNPETHYRPHITSLLIPILSKIYAVPIITTHVSKSILMLSSHAFRSNFPEIFPVKLCMLFSILPYVLHFLSSRCKISMWGEEYSVCDSGLTPLGTTVPYLEHFYNHLLIEMKCIFVRFLILYEFVVGLLPPLFHCCRWSVNFLLYTVLFYKRKTFTKQINLIMDMYVKYSARR